MSRREIAFVAGLIFLIGINAGSLAQEEQPDSQSREQLDERADLTTGLQDPLVELRRIRQRRVIAPSPSDSMFPTSPLTPIREFFINREKSLYERTNLKLGASGNHVMQGTTNRIPGTDNYGMSSFMIYTATWDDWRKRLSLQC